MVADTRLTFEEFQSALRAYVPDPVDHPTPAQLWDEGQSLGEIAERLAMTIGDVAAALQETEAA